MYSSVIKFLHTLAEVNSIMNKLKALICIVMTAATVFLFVSCNAKQFNGKNEASSEDTTEQQISTTQVNYTADWFKAPSIKAQKIFSLPIYRFNQNTNHYEISYGDGFIIKKDDKYGFINSNGKIVIVPEYDSIETCTCYEGYIAVKKGVNSETIYHITPSLTVKFATSHDCDKFNGYSYRWDKSAKKLSCNYSSSQSSFEVSLSPTLPETAEIYNGTQATGKYALISGKKAVNQKDYDAAGYFTGGLAAVCEKGKWGYINSSGKTVIPFMYSPEKGHYSLKKGSDTPYECSEGYVTVFDGIKYGIYSSDGTMVVPCVFKYLTPVHDGRAFASKDGSNWGIICVDDKISKGIPPENATFTQSYTYNYNTGYNNYNYYTTAYTYSTTAQSYSYNYSTTTTASAQYTSVQQYSQP